MTRYLVARANLLVFGVLVVILALVGVLTWERLNESRVAREWSQHSYRVLGTTKDLAIALRDAERGQRGYLLTRPGRVPRTLQRRARTASACSRANSRS